jgi:hypothetical protein
VIVISPLNWGWFVFNKFLAGFAPIVVLNIRNWGINLEVLSSWLIKPVEINNWFFELGSILLEVKSSSDSPP